MRAIASSDATELPFRGRRGRAPATRASVIAAVRDLLKVRRLEDLTVNEITQRAGISRPTFYAHFDTKFSVVAALIEDIGKGVYALWRPFFDGEGPIEEDEIRKAAAATIAHWRGQAALFTATVEGWHSDGEIHDAWNNVLERFTEALVVRLEREREIEEGDDLIAGALVAIFERCLYMGVSMPDSRFARSDEELAAMLARLWCRALLTGSTQ